MQPLPDDWYFSGGITGRDNDPLTGQGHRELLLNTVVDVSTTVTVLCQVQKNKSQYMEDTQMKSQIGPSLIISRTLVLVAIAVIMAQIAICAAAAPGTFYVTRRHCHWWPRKKCRVRSARLPHPALFTWPPMAMTPGQGSCPRRTRRAPTGPLLPWSVPVMPSGSSRPLKS